MFTRSDWTELPFLPSSIKALLEKQIAFVKKQHKEYLRKGAGWVLRNESLMRKYPNTGKEIGIMEALVFGIIPR